MGLGGAFGFQIGGALEASTPGNRAPVFALLILCALALAALSVWQRNRRWGFSRLACGGFCFFAISAHAAARVLPNANDISQLTKTDVNRQTPLKAGVPSLRGYVADYPQRGEFSIEFPLQCIERDDNRKTRYAAQGRVWVSIPPNVKVEVGDAIQVSGELRPLAQATNSGQREMRWRFVLAGCWSELRVKKTEDVRPLQAAPRYLVARKIASIRRVILEHYQSAFEQRRTPFPRATAQLLTAMTFGEGGLNEPLPRQLRDDFRVAGMSHILVASGTQISFLCLLLLGLCRVLGLRRGWILSLVLPILFFYAALAGGAPSIWRAAIGGIFIAWAVLCGRDVDGLTLLSLALIVLVALEPLQLLSLSFQLSFSAAWGLIAFAPTLRKWAQPVLGKGTLTDFAAFSVGAQAGVLPIVLYHFGRVSLAGIGANFLGVPLAGVLVATGIAGLVFPLAALNGFLTNGIVAVAVFAAGLPGAQIERPPVQLVLTIMIYSVYLTAIFMSATRPSSEDESTPESVWRALGEEMQRDWQRRKIYFPRLPNIAIAAVLAIAIWSGFQFWNAKNQLLRVTILDVGQGESILIRSAKSRAVLIDGGSDAGGQRTNVGQSVIVPFLQTRGVKKLDAMVITHADADHCNGLLSVVREIPVALVLDGATGNDVTATEYLELKREILKRKIPLIPARAGQKLNLGDATLSVLAPISPLLQGDNNNAAVLRLDHEKFSMVFTADIEKEAEERLVRRGANLQCTILKVSHHGSQTSSTPLFLKAARPQAAVISCGRYNRFGHPGAGVLQRLNRQKINVFRTDLDGAVEITSDGEKSWIQSAR